MNGERGGAAADVVKTARQLGRLCLAVIAVGALAAVLGAGWPAVLIAVLGLVGFTATQYLGGRYS